MFRTMYKLTKVFSDQPGPRNVTDRLRSKIEKFRLHQPLLNIICNPGIRDRHWEQVMMNFSSTSTYHIISAGSSSDYLCNHVNYAINYFDGTLIVILAHIVGLR